MSAYGVSIIVRSPIFQHELARRRAEQNDRVDRLEARRRVSAREVLDEASVQAAQKQVFLLDSENENLAQRSAMDILDRTGYPKISRSEGRHVVGDIVLTREDLERIQEASRACFGEDFPFEFEEEE